MRWRLWLAPVVALALAGGCSIIPAGAADPSALWNIVNGQCVPHEKTLHEPGNCAKVVFVHGDAGYAVLKDIRGATPLFRRISESLKGRREAEAKDEESRPGEVKYRSTNETSSST